MHPFDSSFCDHIDVKNPFVSSVSTKWKMFYIRQFVSYDTSRNVIKLGAEKLYYTLVDAFNQETFNWNKNTKWNEINIHFATEGVALKFMINSFYMTDWYMLWCMT
jgi:hypothetical protein